MDLNPDEKGMARIEKLSFDAYNESDVLIAAVELRGTLREQDIIRNAYWQIRSTGTETIFLTAGNTESAYPDHLLAGRRKMPEQTKRLNTGIMPTVSKWKEPSPLQSRNTDSV